MRLLAFHHAGGSALSFLPVARAMPAECEPCLFELAGREGEPDSPPAPDFTAAFDRFLPDVLELVDRPTVVIGHSMGALFAHNLVCALPERQQALVRAVVVSSSRSAAGTAAAAPMPAAPFVVRTPQTLGDDLRAFGGVDPEALEDAEFREFAVTLLGHDLHLADTYSLPAKPAEGVDYQVWYGSEDRTRDEADRRRWDESFAAPALHRDFRGGHFYLYERPEAVTALRELVARAADPLPAGS